MFVIRKETIRYISNIIFLLLISFSVNATSLSIKITGVQGELYDNVLAYLSLNTIRNDEDLTEKRIQYSFDNAQTEIRNALKPFGYYQPTIDSNLSTGANGLATATFNVSLGKPITIKTIVFDVTGEMRKSPPDLPFQVGDILNQKTYDQFKSHVIEDSWEKGYLDAKFKQASIRIDPQQNLATIKITFDSGARYRLGAFIYKGDALDSQLLQRYSEWAKTRDTSDTEQYYTGSVVRKLHRALVDSQYFSSVDIHPDRSNVVDGKVPVIIDLKPYDKDKYRFGGGYATDTGARVVFDWRRRLMNRSGHSLFIESYASQVKSQLTAQYRFPLENPVNDYFSIDPKIEYYDTSSRKGTLYEIGSSYSQTVGKWRRTFSLDYTWEDYDIAETNDRTKELVAGVHWSLLNNDNILKTSQGYRLNFALYGAVKGLVTDVSFLQGKASAKYIYSINQDWRFITRAETGVTLTDSVDDLASSRRFFAGGDSSIRGYKYEELGPTNNEGSVIGGRYLALASAEIEKTVYEKWGVAAFVDAGNAFDPDYNNTIAVGVGMGLRWLSPIGLVRFDFAWGVDKPSDNFRLHVVLGPDL